jgi:aminoglycoside phosphotransferase (APT) family kinase protein
MPALAAAPARRVGCPAVAEDGSTDDLIDVRPDERFDERRLADWLRSRAPEELRPSSTGAPALEGADRPLRVRQFGGGHANLTYLLRFGDGPEARELVLRRPPLGPVAPGAHDMRREYRVLSRLWRAYPLAPRAWLHCDDPAVIGAEFFVMERRPGVVVRNAVPERFGGGRDPEANRKLSEVVIDTLAALHAVDPAAVGLQDLGKPEGFLRRQVRGWAERFERARTQAVPAADEVVRWLERELPASPAPTLVHNDWKLDNMAVACDDPGRCVAVYDWDMCTLGDPLCDLGTLLSMWTERGEPPAGSNPMPSQVEGFLGRADAARRYAVRSGLPLDALGYYVVFGTFKMAVVLQQIFFRYERGQTQDRRFAGLGAAAADLFRLAGERRRGS